MVNEEIGSASPARAEDFSPKFLLSDSAPKMTVVPAPAKVLVTGANGYVAMWLVRILLEQGYTVRGTVRTADKGKHLTEYFGKRGFGPDKLEMVVVADITEACLINLNLRCKLAETWF